MNFQNNYAVNYNDSPYLKYKPCVQTPPVSTLDDLMRELYTVFESDNVNVEYVHQLMYSYKSNPVDWKRFAKFDRCSYTRNLASEGNGKFNLIVLCWGEGHGSAIHDHADAHCFMKVLQGSLHEIQYAWPRGDRTSDKESVDNRGVDNNEPKELQEIFRNEIHVNEVAYINDTIGLHRVENLSNVNPAVSLHLYCPPYNKCNVFNERTGKKTLTKVNFWSKFGEKRDRDVQSSRTPEDN